jgi:hypothetical protein
VQNRRSARCERKKTLEFRKILFSKNLAGGVSHQSPQNLEPQGLTCKILQNKYLAQLACTLAVNASRLGIPMMDGFQIEAQGQMSQRGECGLWKSAEWLVWRAFYGCEISKKMWVAVSGGSPAGFALRRRPSAERSCFLFFFLTRPLRHASLAQGRL